MTDLLQRTSLPVADNRQIHLAFVLLDDIEYDSMIGLAHLTLLELAANVDMSWLVKGYHHDSRCVQIQSVHNSCRRVVLLKSGDEAVLIQGVAARDAEQQVGFSHQQQIAVLMEYGYFFGTVWDKIGG